MGFCNPELKVKVTARGQVKSTLIAIYRPILEVEKKLRNWRVA